MPRNPSALVVASLARLRASFARKRIVLATEILPVLYDLAGGYAPTPVPDVIVHIGVAARRRHLSVETRAHHRRSARHPDASGRAPRMLRSGERAQLRIDAAWNARVFAAALKREGVPTAVSRDAGAYVCNALLYRSLDQNLAPALFIHIPAARACKPERIARALARTLPDAVIGLARRTPRVRTQ